MIHVFEGQQSELVILPLGFAPWDSMLLSVVPFLLAALAKAVIHMLMRQGLSARDQLGQLT